MEVSTEPLGAVWEHPIVISETTLDMFGHVNNAAYLTLFEQARWEILATNGYGVKDIMRTGHGPTILEVRLQFKREIRARDKINVRSFVTNQVGKITYLRQIMVKESGEEAAIADFVVGLFDVKARKLIDPTAEWKKMMGIP